MGLIDEVRKKRDPWTKRFEEQRRDDYSIELHENESREEIQKKIEENKRRVGKFGRIDKQNDQKR